MITSLITIGLLAATLFYLAGRYNGLVALRNRVKNAFAQIDVQLQRRYDLIPNLVETAKGYMKHERETLEAVIAARNKAMAAASRASSNPADHDAMEALVGAEAALGNTLTRFLSLTEAYPDLKANENMGQLQEELASTENRIAFARQAYNDAVMAYNTRRESFPDVLIAGHFDFREADPWTLEETAARQNVRVDFGSTPGR